jgi:hypothetical protein
MTAAPCRQGPLDVEFSAVLRRSPHLAAGHMSSCLDRRNISVPEA